MLQMCVKLLKRGTSHEYGSYFNRWHTMPRWDFLFVDRIDEYFTFIKMKLYLKFFLKITKSKKLRLMGIEPRFFLPILILLTALRIALFFI